MFTLIENIEKGLIIIMAILIEYIIAGYKVKASQRLHMQTSLQSYKWDILSPFSSQKIEL